MHMEDLLSPFKTLGLHGVANAGSCIIPFGILTRGRFISSCNLLMPPPSDGRMHATSSNDLASLFLVFHPIIQHQLEERPFSK